MTSSPRAGPFVPAEVFHPAQLIADESIARGWRLWDLVERIGALDATVDVLAYMLFAASAGFDDVALRRCTGVGEYWASDLQRVLGIDAEIWERTLALCNAHPERIAPLDAAATAWYDLEDDDE